MTTELGSLQAQFSAAAKALEAVEDQLQATADTRLRMEVNAKACRMRLEREEDVSPEEEKAELKEKIAEFERREAEAAKRMEELEEELEVVWVEKEKLEEELTEMRNQSSEDSKR